MYYYVYQITNLSNGKIYVGKHKSAKHPFENGYFGSGKQITAAIKKYGVDNFKKEVLCYCNDAHEMAVKESEIVTEDFVKRVDTYNMHKGGYGGFEHINNNPVKRKEVTRLAAIRNKELGLGGTKNWTEKSIEKMQAHSWGNKIKAGWSPNNWIKMSNDKKEEIRNKISKASTGTGNSQYGRIWISNELTKEVKRITIHDAIPDGWVRGKKGHRIKECWVNNGVKEHFINLSKKQEYLDKGFIAGRLKTSVPQKRNSLKVEV
jgi:hypothetical protein